MFPPRRPGSDDHPATPQRRDSARDDDLFEILASRIALRPPNPSQTALSEDHAGAEQQADFDHDQNDADATWEAVELADQSPFASKRLRSLASIVLLVCAVGGASTLLAWAMFPRGAAHVAQKGDRTTSSQLAVTELPPIASEQTGSIKRPELGAALDNGRTLPVQVGERAAVPDPRPEQQAVAHEPTQQPEPVPTGAVHLPSEPEPSGGSTQGEAAPTSSPNQHTGTNEPVQLVGPAAVAAASSPPAPQPSEGASAQAEALDSTSKQQAAAQVSGGTSNQAEAAPVSRRDQQAMTTASAAVEPSLPQQAITQAPTQKVEPEATAATPSPPALQPSDGVSTLARPVPDASPEHQAKPRQQLAPRFEPALAVGAPPEEGVSTQVKPAPEARPEQPPKTAAISGPQSAPARESSTALHLDSDEISALIDRGSALLKRGDLASARLLLRRAADAGSADAALMLGSTFDPAFIQQLGVVGIQPDVARAREWYQKAAGLGSDAATQRLANLKNQ
jgi:hypothetical protein